MPLTPGSNVSDTIRELHGGTTFKRTAKKFGVEDARRQSVAIALSNARKGRAMGGVAGYDSGGGVDPVQAVITALSQGSGGSSGSIGFSPNPVPPSAAPTPVAPPAAPLVAGQSPPNQFNSTLNDNTGVAPPQPMPTTPVPGYNPSIANQAQNTGTTQNGVAPGPQTIPGSIGYTPNNPMMKPLMARGGALERASGGFNMSKGPNLNPSWEEKQEARSMMRTGPVASIMPGRADTHAMRVPNGSYILPASHLASMGQGNSMAGLAIAHSMFGGGPFGMGTMKMSHGPGAPRPPRPPHPMGMMSSGGNSEGGARGEVDDQRPVDVRLSGGEFIVSPQEVRRIGKGSLKNGHKVLDSWVMETRRREIATQRKLPPPAKK